MSGSKVLIVGGGTAGITVAARLRRCGFDQVTIIDPATKHYYQPLFTLVGAGATSLSSTVKNQIDLIPQGVNWIQEAVVEFKPSQNEVKLKSGAVMSYDYLVACPGIQINWKAVEGLSDALGKDGVCSIYEPDQAEKTWTMIRSFSGGDALFTFPATPVKCAGAPQKIMYLADDHFENHGIKPKCNVQFVSSAATIFGVKKYAVALQRVIDRKSIKASYRQGLTKIDASKKEATFKNLDTGEFSTRHYDLIHVVPPMSAPDFIKSSELANADGWVDVDKQTLRHVRFKNIFALGDASSLPTSRTGAAIRAQAPVLVQNLKDVIEGREPSRKYDGYTSCPLITGYGKLILAEFDYALNPRETFPFDQSQERLSMYLLKKYILPLLYWFGMLKGIA
jgi:sulfide:quinone oxidoreductase